MKALAIFGSIFGALILAVVMMFISANNWAVKQEAKLDGLDQTRQSVLATYEQKVMTAVQVPEMYRDDLTKVIRETVQGRYGQEGSKAVFQAISEANIQFDSGLYRKIQDLIEIGRNDYQQAQTELTDASAAYKAGSGVFPRNVVLGILGYPKVNLDDYKPVLTDRVTDAFKTKKEAPLKLR